MNIIKNEDRQEELQLYVYDETEQKPIQLIEELPKSNNLLVEKTVIVTKHSESNLVPCTLCDRTYKSKRALYNHLRLNHKAGRTSTNVKKSEQKSTTAGGKYKCDNCGKCFYLERQLYSHDCEDSTESLDKNPIGFDELPFPEDNQAPQSEAIDSSQGSELDEKVEHSQKGGATDNDWQNDEDSNVEELLIKHNAYKVDDLVQCPQCDRSYKSKRALWTHLRINHKRTRQRKAFVKNHRCDNCGKTFNTSAQLKTHKCKNASTLAETPIDFEEIQMMVTKTEIEIVGSDIKEFKDESTENDRDMDWKKDDNFDDSSDESEQDDKNSESAGKPFPCTQCDRAYKSRRGLWNHRRIHHNPLRPRQPRKRNHKCDECGDLFHSEQHLRGHMYKHTGIVCDICGKKFTQTGNLTLHKIRHTGVKAHKCAECDNCFFTEKELRSHMMRHTGIWPHICEICGRRCRDHGVLTLHMRRHTGERPAKCEICGKCFYSGHDLNVHAVTHSTERPFTCDVCSATFRSKKALRVHKKLHTKDTARKHECKVCGKTFLQSSGLHSHMRTHDAATIGSVHWAARQLGKPQLH